MSSNDHPIHHGTFADGEAHPQSYAGEDHVGTSLPKARRSPARMPTRTTPGSFAEGEARPEDYTGEDHVGTFAAGDSGHQG